MKKILLTIICVLGGMLWAAGPSGEEQAARQARSVHLGYKDWKGPAQVFYMEATIEQFAAGSYACLLGFDGGYIGVQELTGGEHIAIFSIWEPGGIDFKVKEWHVDPSIRTQCLYQGEHVAISRFGGEGTGGKSMVGYAWELGKPIRMAVSVKPAGEHRTAYTGWIWDEEGQGWFRMATFSSLVGDNAKGLTGPYSFLEDFRRNIVSREKVRVAQFGRLWAWNGAEWSVSDRAQFTGDSNTLMTIDAGPSATGFWLATGGKTANRTAKLWSTVTAGGVPDDSEQRRAKLLTAIQFAQD